MSLNHNVDNSINNNNINNNNNNNSRSLGPIRSLGSPLKALRKKHVVLKTRPNSAYKAILKRSSRHS